MVFGFGKIAKLRRGQYHCKISLICTHQTASGGKREKNSAQENHCPGSTCQDATLLFENRNDAEMHFREELPFISLHSGLLPLVKQHPNSKQ